MPNFGTTNGLNTSYVIVLRITVAFAFVGMLLGSHQAGTTFAVGVAGLAIVAQQAKTTAILEAQFKRPKGSETELE